MKSFKGLAIILITTASAFAQGSGFFISASGGTVQMRTGDFAVYNPAASVPGQPLGEALPVIDKSSRVAAARLTLGYVLNESWDIRLSYADYGTANVQLAGPLYPGIVYVVTPDQYTRHELKYDSAAFTLLPTYRHPLGKKLNLWLGAGLSYSQTSAHLEATIKSYTLNQTSSTTDHRYAEVSQNNLSYLLTVGADYAMTNTFSIGLNGTYTTMKTKIPSSPWANRTKSDVTVSSLGAELSATWHW